jgi:hypothetical protein
MLLAKEMNTSCNEEQLILVRKVMRESEEIYRASVELQKKKHSNTWLDK